MSSPGALPSSTVTKLSLRPAGPRPNPAHPQPNAQITFAPTPLPYFNNYNEPKDPLPPVSDTQRGTVSRGALLHKGFYDLLSLIPNTASTLGRVALGGARGVHSADGEDIGGPRYEALPPAPTSKAPVSNTGSSPHPNPSKRVLQKKPPTVALEPRSVGVGAGFSAYFYSQPPKQSRRVSKDSISAPTGFVYVANVTF